MAAQNRYYRPLIVRPSDWRNSTWGSWGIAAGMAVVISFFAVIGCLIAATNSPATDSGAKANLRIAWRLVQQDAATQHNGLFPPFKEIQSVIENGDDQLGFTDYTAHYGVGPAGVHDSLSTDILVDVHSTPRFLEMFIHSDSGRDIELTARPGHDPKIFYPAGQAPKANPHPIHQDSWKPMRVLGYIELFLWGSAGLILLLMTLIGNALIWRNDHPNTKIFKRIPEGIESYRARKLAKERAAEDEAKTLERWRALVGYGVYGPTYWSAGFEVFVADKTEDARGVHFIFDCYRWNSSLRDWVKVTDQVKLPTLSPDVQMNWDSDAPITKVTEAWFDLASWVDRMNRARWASIDPDAAAKAIGSGDISAILPSPQQMIDGAPKGIEALHATKR
jgi:hypothetical protein